MRVRIAGLIFGLLAVSSSVDAALWSHGTPKLPKAATPHLLRSSDTHKVGDSVMGHRAKYVSPYWGREAPPKGGHAYPTGHYLFQN